MVESKFVPISEHEERPGQKVALIMYPDARTTGGVYQAEGVVELGFLEKQFLDFNRRNLERYRRHGFDVMGVVYSDTTETTFSPLYPRDLFTRLLPIQAPLNEWRSVNHQEVLDALVRDLRLDISSQVVLGGYHREDCVRDIETVLQKRNIPAIVDSLLTNELGPLIVSREVQRRLR